MHQSLVTTATLHPGMTYADDSRNIEQNQVTARLVLFIELDNFHIDPIKNEGARVVTTLFINFNDAQGELTPK